jgi:hypothetical protein
MIYLTLYIISIIIIGLSILVVNYNLKNDKYKYDVYCDVLLVRKVFIIGMFIPFINCILVCIIILCTISKIIETLKERIKIWKLTEM